MQPEPAQLPEPPPPPKGGVWKNADGRVRSGWVISVFAAVAIVIGLIVLTAVEFLGFGGPDRIEPKLFFSTGTSMLSGIAATIVCWLIFREETALDTKPALPLVIGFGAGALALSVSVLMPVLARAQTLELNPNWSPVTALIEFAALAPAGIGEELLLRGLALQALRRGIGDKAAVMGSSVLFGILHLTNPHATWEAAAIITLVGFWFGAAMVRTGKIWVPMGMHIGWNFFEGCVFGQPVSGLSPGTPLLTAWWPAEPGFWSGANFGPEAAGWTVIVLLVATAITATVRGR